jgi:hypothetical protein
MKSAEGVRFELTIRKRQQTEPVAPDYRLPHIRLKSNKHNGPGTLTLVILGRTTLRISPIRREISALLVKAKKP